MPFQVIKTGDKFQLKKIKDGTIINKKYNSKITAINAGMNFMRYRKEKPYVSGNKILARKR